MSQSKGNKPAQAGNRNQTGRFRNSGDDTSRHTPEKAQQKERSKSGSDKARGEST